jgi:hypothetical protein
MGLARRATFALSALVAIGLMGSQSAVATATVTGTSDGSSRLVIDPCTNPTDALQLRLNVAGTERVAFIERMPTTKTTDQASLGDFQFDGGDCSTPMRLMLYVREHPAGDTEQSSQVAYAAAPATVPNSAGGKSLRPVSRPAPRGAAASRRATGSRACRAPPIGTGRRSSASGTSSARGGAEFRHYQSAAPGLLRVSRKAATGAAGRMCPRPCVDLAGCDDHLRDGGLRYPAESALAILPANPGEGLPPRRINAQGSVMREERVSI